MSDIWIKTSNTGTTRWRKAVAISIKRGSSLWSSAKNVWIKNGTNSWLRVWPLSGVFASSDPYITTTSSGTTPLDSGNVIRIGTTYYGRNGVWDPNGWTISSYSYSWRYWSGNVVAESYLLGTLQTGTFTAPSNAFTISSAADATATDKKYISFAITANASSPAYSGTADSQDTYGRIQVVRRIPLNISAGLTGTVAVGGTLTYSSSWNTTEARKIDTSRSTMRWYKSTSNTDIYEGGSRTEISRAYGSYSITLEASDNLDGFYIIAEESVYNSGSDYDIGLGLVTNGSNQITKVSASPVISPYVFEFGKTLHVGTNGYISLDSPNSVDAINSTVGKVLGIFPRDLQQLTTTSIWYWSDTDVFKIRWEGHVYGDAANLRSYEVTFYNGYSFAIVHSILVSSAASGTAAFVKDGITLTSYPSALSTGSSYIVNFNGSTTPNSYLGYVPQAKSTMLASTGLTSGSQDIGYTSITTAINQTAPIPTNTSLPTLTTNTGNFSSGSVITVNTGSWNNVSSYKYELLWGSTTIADNSTNTKTLINTNQYVITDADAVATSYYFRPRVTGYSGSGQTGEAVIAVGSTSARSTLNPTTTISVGTATSSGFTVSGTAGPLNGFGTSYVSVSSIEIFNQSLQLVSTITTGLPVVNGTTGAWSYVWSGGSSSTTYYARATIKAGDTAQTTFTSGFSSSITTSQGVSTPTSLSADVNASNQIILTFSGGSGDQYDIFYANSNSRPTDGSVTADKLNAVSPYNASADSASGGLGLSLRGVTRWFWVRKSTGTIRSNWFPASGTVVTARIPLAAPPTPTITNSATGSTSLSWHWSQPTPSASQDEPTSWDWALTSSTSTPTTWPNNVTTRPTSTSPLVTGSLTASTDYYLHVRAKNADSSSTTYLQGTTSATVTAPTATASATRGYNAFTIAFTLANTSCKSVVIKRGTTAGTYGTTVGTFTANGSTTISSLANATTYYYQVTPWTNNDGTGTSGTAIEGSVATYTNPAHTGNTPANPTFQRNTVTGANSGNSYIRYGWNSQASTLQPTGDYAEWGFQFQIFSNSGLTTPYAGPFTKAFTTGTDARLINGLSRTYVFSGEGATTPYAGDFPYTTANVWGRYRPYYVLHGTTGRVYTGAIFSAAV